MGFNKVLKNFKPLHRSYNLVDILEVEDLAHYKVPWEGCSKMSTMDYKEAKIWMKKLKLDENRIKKREHFILYL
jgi:hypothetical protein